MDLTFVKEVPDAPTTLFCQPSCISQNSAHSKLSHLVKYRFVFMTRGIMSVFEVKSLLPFERNFLAKQIDKNITLG